MCNLYGLPVTRWEYSGYFATDADWREKLGIEKDYASPGKPAPVVVRENRDLVLKRMVWGFPEGKRERKTKPKEGQSPWIWDNYYTNARNLKLGLWKPFVADSAHHCLVPFTSFAEPKAKEARTATDDLNWWFSIAGQDVAAFAGVWKHDADHGAVFSFLTSEPNPLVAPLHPKAMPVILQPEDYDRWLSAGFDESLELQAPYPSQLMGLGPDPMHARLEVALPEMPDAEVLAAFAASKPNTIVRQLVASVAEARGLL